jgi:ubiquinone biosynthesis protein
VHFAKLHDGREVAVKVLRPGMLPVIEKDLGLMRIMAAWVERLSADGKRLKPREVVTEFDKYLHDELDLMREASNATQLRRNMQDVGLVIIPEMYWDYCHTDVMVMERMKGVPISQVDTLRKAGVDIAKLARDGVTIFFTQVFRDGFFHADMHPGNLFIDPEGRLVPVDFGIMGRLGMKERRFLAEILYGFITRNYARVSAVHFEAGYVPADHDPAVFAQALRAIGEPLMDKRASEISMARLLSQLLQVTDQFDMRTQPQLLLLQKTMVVVEGVARTLNPQFNMWLAAEPVVRSWVEERLGPQGRMEEAAEGAAAVGRLIGALPEVLGEAQRTAHMLGAMADRGGIRLDQETTESLAQAQARHGRSGRIAMWIGALALAAIALALAGALHY